MWNALKLPGLTHLACHAGCCCMCLMDRPACPFSKPEAAWTLAGLEVQARDAAGTILIAVRGTSGP